MKEAQMVKGFVDESFQARSIRKIKYSEDSEIFCAWKFF
jgi:hypothetical protein